MRSESSAPAAQPNQHTTDGLWRDGELLVVRTREPRFPPRCVVTNAPYFGPPTLVKLKWSPYPFILALLLVATPLAYMFKDYRAAVVYLPVSSSYLIRLRRWVIAGCILFAIGIVMMLSGVVGSYAVMDPRSAWALGYFFLLIFAGIGVAFTGTIIWGPPVTARKISSGLVWLKGVHPALVRSVPEWPYGEEIVYVD